MSADYYMWCDKCESRYNELKNKENITEEDKEFLNNFSSDYDFESVAFYGQPCLNDDGSITLNAGASCNVCGFVWNTKK